MELKTAQKEPITSTGTSGNLSPTRFRASTLHRKARRTSYKPDSEDSNDDTPLAASLKSPGSQKRILQHSITPQTTGSASKRHKNFPEIVPEPIALIPSTPLISVPQLIQHPQHQTRSTSSTTVSIANDSDELNDNDLLIELPTKLEPEYFHNDEEQNDNQEDQQDALYSEPELYSDVKYDENYFTENDDTKIGPSGLGDSYASEAGNETTGAGTEPQCK